MGFSGVLIENDLNDTLNKSLGAKVDRTSAADTAWVLAASALVFIMIPGVGYFYGGLTRRKSQLTMLLTSGLALGIVLFEWWLWGYTLAFSQTGSRFIGDFDHVFLIDVGRTPHPLAPTIPCNLYMLYQGMFACLAPVLAFGSAAERTTMTVYALFVFLWSTLVYNFVAYWHWAKNGWLHEYGVLDFAGGTPVHICAGFSAFAYALCVGPRRTLNLKKANPSNISDVFLGTCLIWFGFFGFSGGSEFSINFRAVNAVINCNLAAGVGGLTWMIAEMIKHNKTKMSLNGFCAGAMSGLCVITPSAGYIRPHFAVVCGIIAGIMCLIAVDIKRVSRFKYDDACDVFAVHGTGGFVGCLLTGFFADKTIFTLPGGPEVKGGWVNGHYMQVVYQLLAAVVASAWAFIFTFIILQLLGVFPCLRLKLTEEEERLGSDWIAMGELIDPDEAQIHEEEIQKSYEKELSKRRETNWEILKSYFQKSNHKVKDSNHNPPAHTDQVVSVVSVEMQQQNEARSDENRIRQNGNERAVDFSV